MSLISTADGMFRGCESLETFNSNLKSAATATGAFSGCVKLSTFNCNLEKLSNGA